MFEEFGSALFTILDLLGPDIRVDRRQCLQPLQFGALLDFGFALRRFEQRRQLSMGNARGAIGHHGRL